MSNHILREDAVTDKIVGRMITFNSTDRNGTGSDKDGDFKITLPTPVTGYNRYMFSRISMSMANYNVTDDNKLIRITGNNINMIVGRYNINEIVVQLQTLISGIYIGAIVTYDKNTNKVTFTSSTNSYTIDFSLSNMNDILGFPDTGTALVSDEPFTPNDCVDIQPNKGISFHCPELATHTRNTYDNALTTFIEHKEGATIRADYILTIPTINLAPPPYIRDYLVFFVSRDKFYKLNSTATITELTITFRDIKNNVVDFHGVPTEMELIFFHDKNDHR
jgi:hypothetical protein